jgi:hypothetical protein
LTDVCQELDECSIDERTLLSRNYNKRYWNLTALLLSSIPHTLWCTGYSVY